MATLPVPEILTFAVSLPAGLAATYLATGWLSRRRILDHPNARSSHSQAVPRGAGLLLTPLILLIWAGLALAGIGSNALWLPIGAAVFLLALSWTDDRHGLPAAVRLLGHCAAVFIGLIAMPADALVFQGVLPPVADRIMTGLAWVWFINLYNFMDGIDGIAGIETLCLGLGLALLPKFAPALDAPASDAALALALAGTALGFLVWNWHPARIFLGDSGSVPFGFLLGWLLLSAAWRGQWAAALILPAYYLADATLTLLRRLFKGEKIWQAHRQHFYQRAVQGGASHARVVSLVLIANIVLIALALASIREPRPALIGGAAAVAALLLMLSHLAARTGRAQS
jgi:UDP-N-acetylmuramyl pentapeptide phosphotransferase/UDP-N-acetylglucosamine-1-phosphate transferase